MAVTVAVAVALAIKGRSKGLWKHILFYKYKVITMAGGQNWQTKETQPCRAI